MLQFLVSTMNCKFSPEQAGLDLSQCIIVNQVDGSEADRVESWTRDIIGKGGVVVNAAERGLSRSRNCALAAAAGDICVIADDDVIFDPGVSEKIDALFREYPHADVITFQARYSAGRPLRRYRRKPFTHNLITVFNVASIEIAFRRSSVIASGIQFDERFGLGSEFVSGEENIFIADLIKAGKKVIYVPESLVVHPDETSGGNFERDIVVISKGAIIKRVYGIFSLPIVLAFAFKKAIQHNVKISKMIRLMLSGWSRL